MKASKKNQRRNRFDFIEIKSEMEQIYRDLEGRLAGLERSCQVTTRCCRFKLTGRVPVLTLGEAVYAAKGVKASGKTTLRETDGDCPLINASGGCTIYQHRPFGCRTHFCVEAGGVTPRKLVADLIQRLEALDERLGGEGARPLPPAIAAVLADGV